jgi:hypothetical protein
LWSALVTANRAAVGHRLSFGFAPITASSQAQTSAAQGSG